MSDNYYNATIAWPLIGHQIAANCSHYLCLDKYHVSNTAYLIEEKKHVTLKHNSQGELFQVYSMGLCGSGADDVFQWNSSIIEF